MLHIPYTSPIDMLTVHRKGEGVRGGGKSASYLESINAHPAWHLVEYTTAATRICMQHSIQTSQWRSTTAKETDKNKLHNFNNDYEKKQKLQKLNWHGQAKYFRSTVRLVHLLFN